MRMNRLLIALIPIVCMIQGKAETNKIGGAILFAAEPAIDSGTNIFRCLVVNQTDDEWLLFVDEEGALPTLHPSEKDLDDCSRVSFAFEDQTNIPHDVIWLRELDRKPDGNPTWRRRDDSYFLFDVPAPGDNMKENIFSIRALNWNRWIEGEENGAVAVSHDTGLTWSFLLEGTNMFLVVENKSSFPRFVHIRHNRIGKPFNSKRPELLTEGPFLVSSVIHEIGSVISLSYTLIDPPAFDSGFYRVLHGSSAPVESRKHSFLIGTFRREKWPAEGTPLVVELDFYPWIVCPLGRSGESDPTFTDCQKMYHYSIKTNIVFHGG